jgi:hypothetical protein
MTFNMALDENIKGKTPVNGEFVDGEMQCR